MFANMGTSKASDAPCFLEIIISSENVHEKQQDGKKKKEKKSKRKKKKCVYSKRDRKWLLPVCWAHHPRHTIPASLAVSGIVLLSHTHRHKVCWRNTPDTCSLTLLQPEGWPVPLASSKEGGLSVPKPVKEEGCQRSRSLSCHTQLLFYSENKLRISCGHLG